MPIPYIWWHVNENSIFFNKKILNAKKVNFVMTVTGYMYLEKVA